MSIIFIVLFLSCISSTSSTENYEVTLLKIKKQLGDPGVLSSWVEGFDFCHASDPQHVGISCYPTTGRVTFFGLYDLDISAPFPDAICDLTELEDLVLYNITGLYGPIPSCITKLFDLYEIEIIGTSLFGSVPSFMNQTNLKSILLRGNHLSGTIPPSLSTLPMLTVLDLSSNYLNGTIPSSLSTLQNLSNLDLSSNYLTGTIPSELVHGWANSLNLSNNRLTGELPRCGWDVDFWLIDKIFQKTSTTQNLSHNKIHGKIPDSFASSHFYDLDLSFNKLCGEIPQGGNLWEFNAAAFANNTCLCGYPLPPCSPSATAPAPAPILEASDLDSSP
ncbi:hypothetical protein LUZ63_016786 [Rhynchospora breviuscula]|uniref:Leucine-rich repeat-containing N-terminal plant-type domain-containing protein n=1 Tax=Rhynchospora breviuscula TaxID=2022672 RepID=A0A9P9ZAJ7_9POAL|nr:hypothetical protein LUZ63_016786 [Rhynchospora breviuscula]